MLISSPGKIEVPVRNQTPLGYSVSLWNYDRNSYYEYNSMLQDKEWLLLSISAVISFI